MNIFYNRILLLMVVLTVGFNHLAYTQSTIAYDDASNYGEIWAGNGGYGFFPWNLYPTDGDAGHFFGSSHGGMIDTDGRAFGMWGNPGYANAELMFGCPLTTGTSAAWRGSSILC